MGAGKFPKAPWTRDMSTDIKYTCIRQNIREVDVEEAEENALSIWSSGQPVLMDHTRHGTRIRLFS